MDLLENVTTNYSQEKRCYTVKELQEILGISRPNVSVLENKLKLLKKDMGIEPYLTGFSGVIKFDCIRMKFFG